MSIKKSSDSWEMFSPVQVFHACLQKMVHAQFLMGRAFAAWHDFQEFYEKAVPSPNQLEVSKLDRDLWVALGYYQEQFKDYMQQDLAQMRGSFQEPSGTVAELFLKLYEDAAESYFYLWKMRSPKTLLDLSAFLADDFAGDSAWVDERLEGDGGDGTETY